MAQISQDRRRVNGPEESFPPVFSSSSSQKEKKVRKREGRGAGDIRAIYLKPGLITQANGSAYIEAGNVKIACSVYGPRQSKSTTYNEKGKLNVQVKFAPFACERRRAPLRDAEDRALSTVLHQSLLPSLRLSLFPKSSIDVFVIVIESDGTEACVAAASIAASTALADAGIEMVGLVVSCSACIIDLPLTEIWLDPTSSESTHVQTRGSFMYSCMPALGVTTNTYQVGNLTVEEAGECMRLCEERCKDVHSIMAQALVDAHKREDADKEQDLAAK